jgi:hypothetical protein
MPPHRCRRRRRPCRPRRRRRRCLCRHAFAAAAVAAAAPTPAPLAPSKGEDQPKDSTDGEDGNDALWALVSTWWVVGCR